jgi:hypothetical protein
MEYQELSFTLLADKKKRKEKEGKKERKKGRGRNATFLQRKTRSAASWLQAVRKHSCY